MRNHLIILCLLLTHWLAAQTEANYIDALAGVMNARKEVPVTSGRVDLVTAERAYEVERAPKWKNAIGQALWYGLQTNRKPGIILLIEKPSDRKYAIQLGSALRFAELDDKIEVRLWPDDFPGVVPKTTSAAAEATSAGTVTDYWLNLSGGKRHRRGCRWFANTKRGRYCGPGEGVQAGCCAGR